MLDQSRLPPPKLTLAYPSCSHHRVALAGYFSHRFEFHSLIRLYTDNLNLTAQRLGRANYVVFNFLAMVGLTMLFQLDFLRIQWVGALVIALYFGCFVYILAKKRAEVAAIKASPKENILDFGKIELAG